MDTWGVKAVRLEMMCKHIKPPPLPLPQDPQKQCNSPGGGDLFRIWSFLGSKRLQILPGAFPEEKRFLEQFSRRLAFSGTLCCECSPPGVQVEPVLLRFGAQAEEITPNLSKLCQERFLRKSGSWSNFQGVWRSLALFVANVPPQG